MGDASFEINVLPAEEGDCIHLRFLTSQTSNKWCNIVIDSGPSSCASNFSDLMERIQEKGEYVDLLCFSHIDDDHIKAAEDYFGRKLYPGDSTPKDLIKQIWMNIPQYEVERANPREPSNYCATSPTAAVELFEYILWYGIPCMTNIQKGERLLLGEVLIEVMGPTPRRLTNFEGWWEKKRPMLNSYISTGVQSTDSSPTNGSSIILLVKTQENKMLFTGDAFAADLKKVAIEEAGNGFALVKLPHHGSARNITKTMLRKMKCNHFIISADGTGGRPAKETIDLLGEYGLSYGKVTLYGNNDWIDATWLQSDNEDGIRRVQLDSTAVGVANNKNVSIRSEK